MRENRSLTAVLALSLLAPALVAAAPPRPELRKACAAGAKFRLSDLPSRALAALSFSMADSNQPFQSTDVILPGPRFPTHRLVCVEPIEGGLKVRFEYGGFGYGVSVVTLRRRADGSFVREDLQRNVR
jgi:hypothetical protein